MHTCDRDLGEIRKECRTGRHNLSEAKKSMTLTARYLEETRTRELALKIQSTDHQSQALGSHIQELEMSAWLTPVGITRRLSLHNPITPSRLYSCKVIAPNQSDLKSTMLLTAQQ